MNFLLVIFSLHVLSTVAFDVDRCPGECHCTMDGLLMLVDCSGLGLTELPEFPDNQVNKNNFFDLSRFLMNHFSGSHAGFIRQ